MGPLTGLCLLFAALSVAWAEDTVTPTYFKDGGTLTLEAKRTTSEMITNILWKFNGNLLAEWVKDKVPLGYYSTFKGRATLHTDSGRLVIHKMSEADNGVYSTTINNKVQSESYNATLIKEVLQPEVTITPLTCQVTSLSCNFTCKASIEGAGPVTYSWRMGDGEWGDTEGDVRFIATKADHAQVKTFTCRIKNKVSEKESEPVLNPLFKEVDEDGSVVGKVLGGVFGALAVVAVLAVVAFVVWKKKNPSISITEPAAGNGQPPPQPPNDNADKPAELQPLNKPPEPKTNIDSKETA